jgi:DNA-binding PadR family transcriptional regulator
MPQRVDLLPGGVDLLILRAVSLGPRHGYGALLRVEQISGVALSIEKGAFYPALYPLEGRGLLKTKWGVSDNNRNAKCCELTGAGVRRLDDETAGWSRSGWAMRLVLKADFARAQL